MNKTDGKTETEYRLAVMMLKALMEQGVIDEEQFSKAKQELIKKYNPIIGGLELE